MQELLTESRRQLCKTSRMYSRTIHRPTFIALAMLISTAAVHAEPVDCVVSSTGSDSPDSELPSCESLYPEVVHGVGGSPWRVGLAAGLGERSNPLINSDDVPIYGMVQLSYFGERFFFDNGDLGWHLAGGRNWNLNAIAGVGGERSFFDHLNEGSIGFSPIFDGAPGAPPAEGEPPPEDNGQEPPLQDEFEQEEVKVEAPDRDFTVDGGLELLYYLGDSELQLQVLTDISDRHNGQEVWLSWAIPQASGRWQWVPSFGVNWKSGRAADYYYGVQKSEAQPGLPAHRVDAATNWFARLTASYSLDDHLRRQDRPAERLFRL